jgi:DNA-directed RNA polymerase sigma subunit (sigma70/sigma32)
MNSETKVLPTRCLRALRLKNRRPVRANGLASAEQSYLRDIAQVKPLTQQAEVKLAARAKHGDKKAREQMLKANLRLVAQIAPAYEGLGLPLLDLLSEGNLGLLKAIQRFDPAKGTKLSAYGSRWIKLSIRRALAGQSRAILQPFDGRTSGRNQGRGRFRVAQ